MSDFVHDARLRERLLSNLAVSDSGGEVAREAGREAGQEPRRDAGHEPQLEAGRPAAVAIAVVPGRDGGAELLMTLRTAGMRDHAAQYALPGGRIDAGESAPDAARRELAEELAVSLPAEAVLGRLATLPSRSGYAIHPIVLWSDDEVEPVPDPGEVARVYRLPLAELDAAVAEVGEVTPGKVGSLPILGTGIFAPTAEILRRFREVALHGRPTGEGWGEPRFAWQ